MKGDISPDRTRKDPNSPGKTIPRSYGVWDIGARTGTKRYRFGNNFVRERELLHEYGKATLIALYTSRTAARQEADRLNRRS